MSEETYEVSIRIAGNTNSPCIHALLSKGYEVTLEYTRVKNPDSYWYPYHPCWIAEKDKRRFSAVCPEELLGLVAMWEIRGNDWQVKRYEQLMVDKVYDTALFYDEEGNIIEHD